MYRRDAAPSRQRGFTLVITLIGLVLLGLLAARFGALTRGDLRYVQNLEQRLRHDALAETALLRAVNGLLQGRGGGFWQMNHAYRWQEGNSQVTVAICRAGNDDACRGAEIGSGFGRSPAADSMVEKTPLAGEEAAGPTSEVVLTIAVGDVGSDASFHRLETVRLSGPKQQPFVFVD